MRASRRTLRVTFAAALALSAVAVPALTGGTASGAPVAGASVAHCNGHAVEVRQAGKQITAKATLDCTGDVGTMRLRTCLEQQSASGFAAVKCVTAVKHSAGHLQALASRSCPDDADHVFRTRAFLFLKDESGQKAHGKVVSDGKVFARLC